MQILKVKEVPLDFDVSGEVADGYRYTGPKTDIKSVSVAGLKTDLASVSTLTIQGPSLNVQGATKNVECEIDLDDYLPSGLTIVGLDSTTINVTLQVEKLIEKTFTVKPEDVTLNGKNSSYSYTVEDTKMEVKVQGLAGACRAAEQCKYRKLLLIMQYSGRKSTLFSVRNIHINSLFIPLCARGAPGVRRGRGVRHAHRARDAGGAHAPHSLRAWAEAPCATV